MHDRSTNLIDPAGGDQPRLTRRRWLKAGLAATAGAVVGLPAYAAFVEPHWVEITRVTLPIRNLPLGLQGCRLVQISDLHVGPIVDFDYLAGVIRQVSALQADIVAITGDFLHHIGPQQIVETESLLKDLAPGRLATVAITGNHDYGEGWNRRSVADRLTDRLDAIGIRMLRNSTTSVGGLQIAGVDDLWTPDFALEQTIDSINTDAASLVLCHNPDAADLPGWGDFHGWILAGHTHGGQCRFPGLGAPILPVTNRRYVAGVVEAPGGRTLYINRGIGYLRRVRFMVRPEITVFELQPAV